MSVVVIQQPSAIRLKFDLGLDPDTQKSKTKTRTYGSIKNTSVDEDLATVFNALASLQEHTLSEMMKISYTELGL